MAIYILLSLPVSLFLIIYHKSWGGDVMTILDMDWKENTWGWKLQKNFETVVLCMGITMLLNIPVSIIFRSDVVYAFNLFFIVYQFCLFMSLTQMQPEMGENDNDSII